VCGAVQGGKKKNANKINLIMDLFQKLNFKKCFKEINRPTMHRVRAAVVQHIKQCPGYAFKK
jgi:hypothetical protein